MHRVVAKLLATLNPEHKHPRTNTTALIILAQVRRQRGLLSPALIVSAGLGPLDCTPLSIYAERLSQARTQLVSSMSGRFW